MARKRQGLTRSVMAGNLRMHHIGREFVALGVLRAVGMNERGIHLKLTDGSCIRVSPDERLDYWLTPEDIARMRHETAGGAA